jgi:hypothetical protein
MITVWIYSKYYHDAIGWKHRVEFRLPGLHGTKLQTSAVDSGRIKKCLRVHRKCRVNIMSAAGASTDTDDPVSSRSQARKSDARRFARAIESTFVQTRSGIFNLSKHPEPRPLE